MFVRLLSITSLAILAIATPRPHARGDSSQCDTGSIQCCQKTETVSFIPRRPYNSLASLLGLLPIVGNIPGDIGLGCSPISVVGLGQGSSCTQEPVCCSNQQYNGLINVGCSPINLNP
ncbi:fungal hydrophobin [Rhizopogon vinicolor AM-OR11-026]|uniref:Hydrophobin n=1 Tax=Rhizopogon vinicolor AM-OR11-026 TaxID=1314800 RepID=A0A1B7N6U4_9AGAM|nr:fungal hydrophobin [Rhizopogon vinicolor AM-OR11-026]